MSCCLLFYASSSAMPSSISAISFSRNRITSYNVCYTKLLRIHESMEFLHIKSTFGIAISQNRSGYEKRPGFPAFFRFIAPETRLRPSPRRVITSYSIHYTKLYEKESRRRRSTPFWTTSISMSTGWISSPSRRVARRLRHANARKFRW